MPRRKYEPHEVGDGAVLVDAQGEVHGDERVLEVSVHDEVGVWQPDALVVVDGVEEGVATLVVVA